MLLGNRRANFKKDDFVKESVAVDEEKRVCSIEREEDKNGLGVDSAVNQRDVEIKDEDKNELPQESEDASRKESPEQKEQESRTS